MDSFGLGLMLNFVDNASGGMASASANMRNMSMMADQVTGSINMTSQAVSGLAIVGSTMTQVGDSFLSAGTTILSTIASISQKMTSMGTELFGTRMTLSTLYGSAVEGEKKFAEAQQYAKSSVFELKDILPTITMMKAVGIEAMADVTTSVGKQTQKLMDYGSDLAAMFPNMRNIYGTGVQAAMGALKEYIAEGNALSLKRGAGLDITGILGEDKGKTIEERTQQVADLIEKMNIFGLTAQMVGTPSQMLSNIQDTLYNTMIKIVDSGVFDEYTRIVKILYDGITKLDNSGDLAILAKIIGESLVSLMKPIEAVATKVVELANGFVAFIKEHPRMAKTIIQLTALAGVSLVVMGVALKLGGAFMILIASLKMLNILSNGQFAVSRSIATAFGGLAGVILPLALAVVVLKQVWERNMFGIRDATLQAFKDITTLFTIVKDAWDNNTLSDENFAKASELGILPFISSLLDLKSNISDFTAGFKAGFNSVFDTMDRLSQKIAPIKTTVFDITRSLGGFLSKFTGIEFSDSWTKFGDIVGKLVGILTIAIPIFKIVSVVIGALSSPIGIAVALVSLLFLAWNKNLFGIQEKTSEVLGYLKNTFDEVFPQIKETAIGVWTEIWGVLQDAYNNILKPLVLLLKDIFLDLFSSIKEFWDRYGVSIVTGIVKFVGTIITIAKTIWTALQPMFQNFFAIVSELWNNHLAPFVSKLLNFIGSIVNAILVLWNNVLAPVVNWLIENFLPPIINVFTTIWDVVSDVISTIVDIIGSIIEVLTGVIDFIVGIFTGNFDLALQGLVDIVQGVVDLVWSIIKGAINILIDGLNLLWTGVYNAVSSIVNSVGDIAKALGELFGQDWGWEMPATVPKIPRLNTGGYIKEEGVSVLHPNEVVVNSKETDSLRDFLNDYERGNSTVPVTNRGNSDNSQNDYSITIESGAIQIIVQKATTDDAEIEAMATKLMKVIERKMQLQQMARTNKPKSKVVFG